MPLISVRCSMSQSSQCRISRRTFIQISTTGFIVRTVTVPDGLTAFAQARGGRTDLDVASIKALVFDTFGTVVDWRTSVAAAVEALAKQKGLSVDGSKFADAWRAQYAP